MTPRSIDRQGRIEGRPHRHGRVSGIRPWFPGCIALLCAWATIPLGSAGQLATTLLIAGCALLAGAHLATAPRSAPPPPAPRLLRASLIALLAWVLLQQVPLPPGVMRWLHPLLAVSVGDLLEGPHRLALAVNPARALHTLTLWLAYAALVWVCRRRCGSCTAARTIAYGLAIAGTFQACIALIGRPDAAPGPEYLRQRLVGSFTGSNALGGYLSLTLLTTLGFLLAQLQHLQHVAPRGGWGRDLHGLLQHAGRPLLLAIALLLQAAALILSGSRGAMIATAIAAGALLLAVAAGARRRSVWRLGGGLVLLLVLLAGSGVLTTGSARLATLTLPNDINVRLAIWEATWQLVIHHPWGVGPGGYADAILRFLPAGFGVSRAYQAHNDWLQALAELGLPGFLLLLLVFLALARQWRPLIDNRGDSSSIWLERGMLLALGAALMHALVDFNLSSRPGVALTAVVILGTLLGIAGRRAAADADDAPAGAEATREASPTRRRILPHALWAGTTLAGLLLVAHDIRLTLAARRVDNAFVAEGGEPLLSTWPALPGGDPARTWSQATRAITHAPADSQIRYRYAQTGIMAFAARRQALITSPPQAGLTPVQWRRAVHLAMRQDEAQTCQALAPWIDQAVAQAPWNADAVALQARIHQGLGPAQPGQAFRLHDRAEQLAPRDPTVLQQLCTCAAEVIAAAPRSDEARAAAPRLRAWSRRVCALPGVIPHEVIAAWELAGWPLNALANAPDASLDSLRSLYVVFDRAGNGLQAHHTINRLAQHLRTTATQTRAFGDPPPSASTDQWVTRERTKWTLRLGQWQAYRDAAPERQRAREELQRHALAELPRTRVAPTLLRLALGKINSHTGLEATGRLRLAQLEADHGDARLAEDLRAAIALSPTPLPPEAAALAALASPTADVGQRLLTIRLAIDEGRHADATHALESLLQANAIPYRFAHQARVTLATILLAKGERDRARTLLQAEAADQPAAVAPLLMLLREVGPGATVLRKGQAQRVIDLLPSVIPPYRLDATFLGEAATLHGIELRHQHTTPGLPPTTRLRLFWTLTQRLPADLAVNVRLQRRHGRTAWSRTQTFDAAARLTFGAGMPVMGLLIPIEFTLPADSAATHRLSIQLLTASGQSVFRSDEGLSVITLDHWPRYVLEDSNAATTNAEPRLTACDEASALEFAPLGPDSSVVRFLPDRPAAVTAGTPSGLAIGSARATAGSPAPRLLLPDPRFRVPHATAAPLPAWSVQAPAFAWRMIGRRPDDQLDAFCADQHLATRAVLRGGGFSHNIHDSFNPELYYADHPDWYPLADGHRPCPTNRNWQLCLSATGIVAHAAQAARTHFEAHPQSLMFALGINDSDRWCACDACRTLCPPEEREFPPSARWWSEPYWRFVNAVSEEVARTHPERRLAAIAYGAVLEPPAFPLRENVMVFVCQDSANRFDARYREQDDARLVTWRARARHLGRYDYAGLTTWVFPRYGIHGVVDGMRVAANLGVSAYYVEDHALPWLDGGQSWILAQALWDPLQPVEALEARFCELAFGPAAKAMLTYHQRLRTLWESAPHATWLGGFKDIAAQARRYPSAAIEDLLQSLRSADSASRGAPDIGARIASIREPLELSLAVAREWEAARDASRRPTTPAELVDARARAQQLAEATRARQERLRQAQAQPWGAIMAQTPAWQQTWTRWEHQVLQQHLDLVRFVTTVQNATADLIAP